MTFSFCALSLGRPRLLAVLLFSSKLSSSYLIQRDCKPRCYYLGIETRRAYVLVSRQAASPLACSNFAKKNKRLLAVYARPEHFCFAPHVLDRRKNVAVCILPILKLHEITTLNIEVTSHIVKLILKSPY